MRMRPATAFFQFRLPALGCFLMASLAVGVSTAEKTNAENAPALTGKKPAQASKLPSATTDKRSARLAEALRNAGKTEQLEAILRLSPASLEILPTSHRQQRLNAVVKQLRQHAKNTQVSLIAELDRLGLAYRSFWISNDIWLKAPAQQLATLIERPEVVRAFSNAPFRVKLPTDELPLDGQVPSAIEWNVSIVNAPAVWALGYTGQGVVVGGQDTGYDWDHPALINAYRGWNGFQAEHNYNWHDAIHTANGTCPANSPQPCDDHGHGTHTMGTIVGDDGQGNQVGVAPGARWIGCRNMNNGFGTPASYTECFQWFVAPTDLNNQNPDTSRAPHVINNSWGCVPSEGCTDPDQLKGVVDNVVAAGIIVVVSAGNGGSACETIADPPAIYASALTVGSTTSNDAISSFSSRGPVTVDGSNRLKPDLSAPGSSVRSAKSGGGYTIMSGTSMASPNVAGVAALLLDASPSLIGQPGASRAVLTGSADPKTTSQNCGTVPGSQSPNNTYGWGRIDALAAVQSQLANDLIFANGFN